MFRNGIIGNNISDVEMMVHTRRLLSIIAIGLVCVIASVFFHLCFLLGWITFPEESESPEQAVVASDTIAWVAPDDSKIPSNAEGELVRYGKELIEHTARYLGPNGKVRKISNGLNCQNCHLQSGTKAFAANYSAVASTYPKFRQRSGTVEGFEKRVNDCLERSLNGTTLDEDSHEMKAIIAYFKWLGKDVARGNTPAGAGLLALSMLDRPADPVRGKQIYLQFCSRCHGENGEGIKADDKIEWKYPPLWGPNSYNTSAGLYRISRFAAFIKANMPFGITYKNPLLTDEEAWDIAAFVNSMPRPHKNFPADWPDLASKPVDHPFGPYADAYSATQHKFGPYGPIIKSRGIK